MVRGLRLISGAIATVLPLVGATTTGIQPVNASGFNASGFNASVLSPLRSPVNGGKADEDEGRGSNGGSRGEQSAVCLINPGVGETVLSLTPLLVLQGNAVEVALRPAGETTALWQRWTPQALVRPLAVQYDGPALIPGQTYEWVLYSRQRDRSLSIARIVPFQVMAAGAERDRITADLAELAAQLTTAGADDETQAQAQVDYFTAADLPAAAFQAQFALADPSADFAAERTALVAQICTPQP